jgi:hypothetical protein
MNGLSDDQKLVLRLVEQHPGCSQDELVSLIQRAVGCSDNNARSFIRSCEQAGVIDSARVNRRKTYHVGARIQAEKDRARAASLRQSATRDVETLARSHKEALAKARSSVTRNPDKVDEDIVSRTLETTLSTCAELRDRAHRINREHQRQAATLGGHASSLDMSPFEIVGDLSDTLTDARARAVHTSALARQEAHAATLRDALDAAERQIAGIPIDDDATEHLHAAAASLQESAHACRSSIDVVQTDYRRHVSEEQLVEFDLPAPDVLESPFDIERLRSIRAAQVRSRSREEASRLRDEHDRRLREASSQLDAATTSTRIPLSLVDNMQRAGRSLPASTISTFTAQREAALEELAAITARYEAASTREGLELPPLPTYRLAPLDVDPDVQHEIAPPAPIATWVIVAVTVLAAIAGGVVAWSWFVARGTQPGVVAAVAAFVAVVALAVHLRHHQRASHDGATLQPRQPWHVRGFLTLLVGSAASVVLLDRWFVLVGLVVALLAAELIEMYDPLARWTRGMGPAMLVLWLVVLVIGVQQLATMPAEAASYRRLTTSIDRHLDDGRVREAAVAAEQLQDISPAGRTTTWTRRVSAMRDEQTEVVIIAPHDDDVTARSFPVCVGIDEPMPEAAQTWTYEFRYRLDDGSLDEPDHVDAPEDVQFVDGYTVTSAPVIRYLDIPPGDHDLIVEVRREGPGDPERLASGTALDVDEVRFDVDPRDGDGAIVESTCGSTRATRKGPLFVEDDDPEFGLEFGDDDDRHPVAWLIAYGIWRHLRNDDGHHRTVAALSPESPRQDVTTERGLEWYTIAGGYERDGEWAAASHAFSRADEDGEATEFRERALLQPTFDRAENIRTRDPVAALRMVVSATRLHKTTGDWAKPFEDVVVEQARTHLNRAQTRTDSCDNYRTCVNPWPAAITRISSMHTRLAKDRIRITTLDSVLAGARRGDALFQREAAVAKRRYAERQAALAAERAREAREQAELDALLNPPDYDYGGGSSGGSGGNWCGATRDGDGDGIWCEGY